MATKDYYAILGVPKDATEKTIRGAYKKLARKYHPDVNPGDKAAEDKFKEVAEAYAVLSNAEKRAEYDRGPEGFDLGFDPSEIFRRARTGGFEGAGLDLGSIFSQLFGQGRGGGGRSFAMRGADAEASLSIEFEDAVRGVTLPLSLRRAGGGSRPSGEQTVQVRIPAGVGDGSRLRLPGKGEPGTGGAPAGDLYVRVRIRPHPVFRREGNDLICDAPLTLDEAALGTKINVQTLDGTSTMSIPAGTRSGQRFRLRGKGVPRPSGGTRGDLYVDVQIVPPKNLDEESKVLLQKLAERNPQPELRTDPRNRK